MEVLVWLMVHKIRRSPVDRVNIPLLTGLFFSRIPFKRIPRKPRAPSASQVVIVQRPAICCGNKLYVFLFFFQVYATETIAVMLT